MISVTALDHMERAVFSYATRNPSTPPAVWIVVKDARSGVSVPVKAAELR